MPVTFESYSEDHPSAFESNNLQVRSDYSNLNEILHEYGVAIIPGILTADECEDSLQYAHRFYEDLTKRMKKPYNHEDPRTYKTLSDVHKLHGMLFQSYGVGQCQGSWNVRQHPKVHEAFARIWNEEDLLTSMDGMAYQIAPEQVEGNRADVGFFKYTWFHTDQSFTRNNLECIQGQVPLYDVAPGDATLVVLESSHKYHKAFAERFGEGSVGDWFSLESRGKESVAGFRQFYLDMGCIEKRISCPRGSLILWDSRTIHCGGEPLRNRPHCDHWRSVVYVCMTPRYLCDKKNMDLRIKAFKELSTTSHWPHRVNIFKTIAAGRFVKHSPYLSFDHLQQYPQLTELGQRLLLGEENMHEYTRILEEAQSQPRELPVILPNGRPETIKQREARVAGIAAGKVAKKGKRAAAAEETSSESEEEAEDEDEEEDDDEDAEYRPRKKVAGKKRKEVKVEKTTKKAKK